VIIVPPDADPSEGLRLAIRHSTQGRAVRLVSRGATNPDFVQQVSAPMVLTELDAYQPADKGPLLAQLLPSFSRWLARVFVGALGVDVVKAFWASAVTRLGLQDVFDAWCLANGLYANHSDQELTVVGAWHGTAALEALGARLAESVRPRRTLSPFFAGAGAAPSAAIALRLREFRREARVREAIEASKGESSPDVWLSVIGSWSFSSRHVLESLAAEARRRQTKVGVVFQSSLRPGATVDAHARQVDQGVLPVLESPQLAGIVGAVDQSVSYSSWSELLRELPGATLAMSRATTRMLASLELDLGPFKVWLGDLGRELLTLTTLDVLRAREAEFSSRRFAARLGPRTRVALSHASLVTDTVPDLVLQSAGAVTFDVVHGALAETLDMVSTAITHSSRKLLWTQAEARWLAPYLGSTTPVGAVPARPWSRRPARPANAPKRVLLLSNYGTLVGGAHRRRFPRAGYQVHLVGEVAKACRALGLNELRWRPHPGDDQAAVARDAERFGPMMVSRGTPLEDDFDWADLTITSLSSTVVEALAWDKPLLLHDIPVHEADVLMSLFPDERRFRNQEELEMALRRALADLEAGPPYEPEQTLRQTLFGPSGHPRSIADEVFGS
jgi:hypothetical protein